VPKGPTFKKFFWYICLFPELSLNLYDIFLFLQSLKFKNFACFSRLYSFQWTNIHEFSLILSEPK
jgi:hypothetical protein